MVMTQKAPPPPRDRLRTGKNIAVGSVEVIEGGRELRCTARDRDVTVALYEDGRVFGIALEYRAPTAQKDGDLIDEGAFSRVLDSYYINSAWHDGEYTCQVITINCLRTGAPNELLTFKDL